jgi:hypothetical protein
MNNQSIRAEYRADVQETVTVSEIAAMAHVTEKYARDRLVTRPDFPAPAFQFSRRLRAWRRDQVRAFFGLPSNPNPSEAIDDHR